MATEGDNIQARLAAAGAPRGEWDETPRFGVLPSRWAGPMADYLRLAAPHQAPALCHPYRHFPLPITAPEVARSESDAIARRRSYVGWVLSRDDSTHEFAGEVAAMLEAGSAAADHGLPAWTPYQRYGEGWSWSGGRQKGAAWKVNAILIAVDADLRGLAATRNVLTIFNSRPGSFDTTSGANGKRREGRKLLHRLGVWPWAHAPDGVLRRGWTRPETGDEIEQALLQWLSGWSALPGSLRAA